MFLLIMGLLLPLNEVDSALSCLNLNRKTVAFERLGWVNTGYVLPRVRKLMNDPLRGEEYSEMIRDALKRDDMTLLKILSEEIGYNFRAEKLNIEDLSDIVSVINQAGKLSLSSFDDLTERDRKILLYMLPCLWENGEDSTDDWLKTHLLNKYGVDIDTTGIGVDSVMKIYGKVRLSGVLQGGFILKKLADNIESVIKNLDNENLPIEVETDFGTLIIGSYGPDEYENRNLVIDPGGNDRYINCGGTMGLMDTLSPPVSFIVDFAGEDTYISSEIIGISSGFCGCAFLKDFSGDDNYKGSHFSIASGIMGLGIIEDDYGDDFYSGGIFSVAAGNFGIGLLMDRKGSDVYKTMCFGEGFAGTEGYGLLGDLEGDDVYYAGGRYYHTPLKPNSYQSLSQGFSIGFRPDWGGGIGFLYDAGGNDFYNGDIYAQGTSYWCSAGFLVDDGGQDRYMATQYAQGAGIHLSYGYLYDRNGDDHYYASNGPSQGEGHDFACGILIDSTGNDWYSVSGGLGVGLNNSFALFVDGSGNDVYNITENLGVGDANYGRGFSGTGIFLDLAGIDNYPTGRGGDDCVWINRDYGVGIDKNSKIFEKKVPQREIPDFNGMNIKELFEVASEWGVGDNQDRVREARKHLAGRGKEAIEYIFDEKLNTESGLEMRAIYKVLEENEDSLYTDYIARNFSSENPMIRENMYRFIGKFELSLFEDSLFKAIQTEEDEKCLRYLLYALGRLKVNKATPQIIELIREEEPVKISAIKALGEIRDTLAIRTMIDQLDNPLVSVRSSSMKALEEYDTLLAGRLIEGNLTKERPETMLIGAEIFKDDSSRIARKFRRKVFKHLKSDDWIIREFAARSLSILGGIDVRRKFELLVPGEPNSAVRKIMKNYLEEST